MSYMKRNISKMAFGLLFLAFGSMSCSPSNTNESGRKVIFIHINDIHSHLLGFGPNLDYTPDTTNDDDTLGGIARIATKMKELRQEAGDVPVLAMDSGDFTMGTMFEFLWGTNTPEMRFLKELGFDATTIGNHEFDFGPGALADYLNKAIDLGYKIPVISSNLVFSKESNADDGLEALVKDGEIQDTKIFTLSNGLKIGVFGLLGKDAIASAPFATPVTIADPIETAKAKVKALKQEGADMIVCLSHSGLWDNPAKSEDRILAVQVPDIDVILSGHSHTLTTKPLIVGNTVIIQELCYGQYLGRLEMQESKGRFKLVEYEPILMDDSIKGDEVITSEVNSLVDDIDKTVWSKMGLSHDTPLAETNFDLKRIEKKENNLYDLVADAFLASVSAVQQQDPPKVAVEAEIRADVLKGKTGKISVMDAFRTMPLGSGPDKNIGYPLVTFFINAKELRAGLEVNASVVDSGLAGGNYYLAVSGMRYEYDPKAPLFNRVKAIYLSNGQGGYEDKPIDFEDENTLYKITATLYVASLIGSVTQMTGGALVITPKDEDGKPVQDLTKRLVDADPSTTEVEELKAYQALFMYLQSQEDTDNDQVPDIPDDYKKPDGQNRAAPISQ
ncbi:MAG: hypothetical protein GXP49_10315 [Deltaproteobacteria bacterium]|nr:hypothetical protein [Deltaproteobacteria bacterium]